MNSYRNACFWFSAGILLVLLLSMSAVAQGPANLTVQEQTTNTPASQKATSSANDGWHFTIAPYLWFPGVHGTVGALGHNASIHVSGADVLSNFDFGLMGAVEARKNRFVLPIDFMWVRLEDNKGIPVNDPDQTSVKVHLTLTLLTPKFGYRIVDTERWKVDALAGIRYRYLGQNFTFQPSGVGRSASANWVDGLGGADVELALSPKVAITVLGDAGGGSANLDYMVAGLLGFKVKPNVALLLGWRYLDVDYRGNHRFIFDVAESGPVLGMTWELGGKPPVPPSASCSVSPTEIWSGDPVTATISAQNFNAKHALAYNKWNSTGGTISGTGPTGNVDTTGLAPGSYSVTATATDEKEKKNNVASCSAPFTVKQPRPPQVSCSASPTTIAIGEPATTTMTATDPQGWPLTYKWSSDGRPIERYRHLPPP